VSWEERLRDLARSFDWSLVSDVAREYVRHLCASAKPAPLWEAKAVLQVLRENQRYDELAEVADALLGQGVADAIVRRQYAQALVDRGNPAAALLMFRAIAAGGDGLPAERIEAQGGIGRCYKQLFAATTDPGRRAAFLRSALDAYLHAYEEDKSRFWHGINAVALLARIGREGIELPGYQDAGTRAGMMAAQIHVTVADLPELDAWAKATMCEAMVALGDEDRAVESGELFLQDPGADAFKINALIRQLVEIWELDTTSSLGNALLPLLRSALLAKKGGGVLVEADAVRAERLEKLSDSRLERVFGSDRYQTLTWYLNGLARCRAVARIETDNEDGIGTGFLVRGPDLHPALPETVLVTNGHVVPEDLPASEALVVFHGLDEDPGLRRKFRIVRQWWYQRSAAPHLDTTLLELDGYPDKVTPIPIASKLPKLPRPTKPTTGQPRAYVIGHPRGLAQPQFSLQDNTLLDYDDTWVHYRSPTEPGSSGSPVFDKSWKLIGLHHAGSFETPKLNNKGGIYAANEAIVLPAIVALLKEQPPVAEQVR
jgi:V8-like Glu-specific endopeptidase